MILELNRFFRNPEHPAAMADPSLLEVITLLLPFLGPSLDLLPAIGPIRSADPQHQEPHHAQRLQAPASILILRGSLDRWRRRIRGQGSRKEAVINGGAPHQGEDEPDDHQLETRIRRRRRGTWRQLGSQLGLASGSHRGDADIPVEVYPDCRRSGGGRPGHASHPDALDGLIGALGAVHHWFPLWMERAQDGHTRSRTGLIGNGQASPHSEDQIHC